MISKLGARMPILPNNWASLYFDALEHVNLGE
jgi:hypothetical protein